jgi:hypothetical protein
MLAAAGDSEAEPIPVAIEMPRGLLVAVLRVAGRRRTTWRTPSAFGEGRGAL